MFCKMMAYMIAHDVVQTRLTSEGKTVYSLSCWAKPPREEAYVHFNLYFSGGRFDGILKHVRKGTRLMVTGTPRVQVFLKRDHSCGTTIRIFVDSIEFAPSSYLKSESSEEEAEIPVESGIEAPPPFEDDGRVPF